MITLLVNGVDTPAVPAVMLRDGHLFAPLRSVIVRLADRVEVNGTRIVVTRGLHRLLLRVGSRVAIENGKSSCIGAIPYQSGTQLMIPLQVVTEALHEPLWYDTVHKMVAITTPSIALSTKYMPSLQTSVQPMVIFTPRPIAIPVIQRAPLQFPRRTPIPVNLNVQDPPL